VDPCILAIDTATRMASIALYDGERVHSEETWHSERNHTVELMPSLVRLLDRQRVSPQELTGLVVALGPGSFTGLRIGLSVAKGLALALKVPLVGASTLDALAYAQASQDSPLYAVVQAGRGRVCSALYRREGGQWRRATDYRITTLADLCQQVEGPTLFCGEIEAESVRFLREKLGRWAVMASPASCLRRAGYLAELGWQRLKRGEADGPATLSPIYLHHPQIGHGSQAE
jgi:tRNA threonylcarbamoyladenosine biosynthesis protein TsaB